MDLTLTDDQELVASTARDFLESRCPPAHVREMADDPIGYSPSTWREMADLGWIGLALPEDCGGAGATVLDVGLVLEQMGRVLLPSPFVPTVLCGMALLEHGADEQRSSRLSSIARGDTIMSYARAAPGSGWATSGSEVVARDEGASLVLDGSAMLVPYADAADELMVVVQHGGAADELSVHLVETAADGVRTEPLDTVRPDHPGRLVLEGVEVDPAAAVGGAGRGRSVVGWIHRLGAALTCAEMVGGAQKVLDMTVDYATERHQFDTPIGAFQAVQHHCADMGVDVLASRLITFEAIWRLSEGLDADHEVAMAKAWVSDAYRRVCALGHQVHGAIGFTAEHDLHHHLRHAVATELAFGDGSHHWGRVADQIGLPAG